MHLKGHRRFLGRVGREGTEVVIKIVIVPDLNIVELTDGQDVHPPDLGGVIDGGQGSAAVRFMPREFRIMPQVDRSLPATGQQRVEPVVGPEVKHIFAACTT